MGKETAGWEVFPRLASHILHQQLSARAAKAIEARFLGLFPGRSFPDPREVLDLGEETFRSVGVSRRKSAYLKDLAAHALGVDGRSLPTVAELRNMSDEDAIQALTRVRGIGRWSVEMLLIFDLGRLDVFPVSDLGICRGMQLLFGWPDPPRTKQLLQKSEPWRPYRSVASWYLWRVADGKASSRTGGRRSLASVAGILTGPAGRPVGAKLMEPFLQCAKCKKILYAPEFEQSQHVCPHCGHHHRLSYRKRIEFTFDPGSFQELDSDLKSVNPLGFPEYPEKLEQAERKNRMLDSVVCGLAKLDGSTVSTAVADFNFMGGSMGSVNGEKIARTLERGVEQNIPVVIFCSSGGARMQKRCNLRRAGRGSSSCSVMFH
ncbi:MAG: carboxyl transferase domain-containing protein [Fimbriimonadaceae bacterium]